MEETQTDDVGQKIARLVEERGWNQEDFARNTGLNRHTARQILLSANRNLRNATISACADALGLSVNELRTEPIDRLLIRARDKRAATGLESPLRRLRDHATQLELLSWLERNPDRAARLTLAEVDELLVLQGDDGPLARVGVDAFVERIERRRQLVERVGALAATEYLDLLEQLVALMYEKVQAGLTRSGRPLP